MKKPGIRFLTLLLAGLLCFAAFPLSVIAEEDPVYELEINANSASCGRGNLLDIFGDSLLSTASYGIEPEGDSGSFKEVTLLSSYDIPAPGFYTAYKTTAKTGSLLNKKPDWSKATTKRVEIKLYYTASCSVSGNENGVLYLNGEAVTGEEKLYLGEEYSFTVQPIDEYEYSLTGAQEDLPFEASSDLEVSLLYTKLAYATVSLNVGEGGSAQILSGSQIISNGKVSEGEGFSVSVDPDAKNGYYLDFVTIEKDGELCDGLSVDAVLDGEDYQVTVSFAKASIEFPDVEVNYLDIERGNYDLLEEAIISQVSFVPDEFADGAEFEVRFLTGHVVLLGDVYEPLNYNPILSSNHKFGYSAESGMLELGNTEIVKVTCTNPNFPGIVLTATATATVVDLRIPTEITSSKTVIITYGDDLKAAVLDTLSVTGADGVNVAFSENQITILPDSLDVKLFELQEIEVYFLGNDEYAPSVGVASIYVWPADSSFDIKSETIHFGETPVVEVRTDPEDLDYILLIAGVDGEASGFAGIYIPKSVQDLMKIDLGFLGTLDLYELLREGMKDGISLEELKNLINNFATLLSADGISDLVQNSNFDLESLQTILNILSYLPDTDINLKITLGNPPHNAGVYLIAGVTANLNYKLNVDLAYLAILPQAGTDEEPVCLRFVNEMETVIPYDDAQEFDFGSVLQVGEKIVDSTHIKTFYFGVTFDGEVMLLTDTPIQKPGVYKEIVFLLGGNYLAKPISRTYAVGRIPVSINIPETVAVYDGSPHEVAFSVLPEELAPDEIQITYSGANYDSTQAPTAAGIYTVTAVYSGSRMYQSASSISILVIQDAADEVVARINAIGDVTYTAESKERLDEARAAYDDLSEEQKALVTNYTTLLEAEAEYAQQQTAEEKSIADHAAAEEAVAWIDAIGDVTYTAESKEKIDEARAAYDALSEEQKALVENTDQLEKAEADYAAVNQAVEMIDAISNVELTSSCKEKIAEAKQVLENLTEEQKLLVPSENKTALANAENEYAVLLDAYGGAKIISASLALGSDITINYYVDLTDAKASAQMRFTMNGKSTVVNGTKKSGEYIFPFSVAPQQMGDNIQAELIFGNEVLDSIRTYSVRQNCLNLLANDPSTVLKNLIADLLEYGAKAQIYTNYKTNMLVNAGITGQTEFVQIADDETQDLYAGYQMSVTTNPAYQLKAAGISFNSFNRLYFKVYAENPTDETFEILITDSKGNQISRLPSTFEEIGKNLYIVYTDAICASELSFNPDEDDYYWYRVSLNTISKSNGTRTTVQTLDHYSVASYVSKQQKNYGIMANLARALYNYGLSAKAYVDAQ